MEPSISGHGQRDVIHSTANGARGRVMRTLAAGLLALCLTAGAATAQTNRDYVPTPTPKPDASQPLDPNTTQTMLWAVGEVAGELQECSVYFGFVEYCIAAQRPDIARTYHAAKEKLNELALKSHLAAGLSWV
jgi:hypothetical protein